jgi:hypothetical protein
MAQHHVALGPRNLEQLEAPHITMMQVVTPPRGPMIAR